MNILITGSNGFVGSNLMWELEKDGHTVIGIDISEHCEGKKHPETMLGDIRSLKDLNNASPSELVIKQSCLSLATSIPTYIIKISFE